MLEKARNSLLFCWATLLSIVASVLALTFLSLKIKSVTDKNARNRSVAFLAEKKRTTAFYRVFSYVYDSVNKYFYTDTMRKDVSGLTVGSSCSRVLDVGCGTGYTTEALLSNLQIREVIGIDLTPQQLKKATRNLEEKKRLFLCRGDADNLPYIDETFDSVVSVGALEYFPDPKESLKEMTRVTKSGGKVIVGAPEFAWFKKTFLNRILYTPSAKEVERFLTEAKLANVRFFLTGVDTFFGTNKYVVIAAGTKQK